MKTPKLPFKLYVIDVEAADRALARLK